MKKLTFTPGPLCPYCGQRSWLHPDSKVYNPGFGGYVFVCPFYPKCDSFVTANEKKQPNGKLANAELRGKRKELNDHLQNIYSMGYQPLDIRKRLAELLGLDPSQYAAGILSVEQINTLLQYITGDFYERIRKYNAARSGNNG
jgi:hypothetical protein